MKPDRNPVLVVMGCAMGALVGAACADREHIRDDFGVRNRAFLQKQHVHAEAAEGSPTGLDSEEAAMIQAKYRDSMGAEAAGEDDQVLVIQEPKKGSKGK